MSAAGHILPPAEHWAAHGDGFRSIGTYFAMGGVSKDLLPEFP